MQDTVSSGSKESLRRWNRQAILQQVLDAGPISRTEIAQRTGLTSAAVSRITRELVEVGLLEEGSTYGLKGRPGRRFVEIKLRGSGAYVLGIGTGANEQAVTLANSRGETIARREVELIGFESATVALGHLVNAAEDLIDSSGIDRHRLLGGGVAIAATVEAETGRLIESPVLGWRDVPVAEIFEERLGIPITVESRPYAILLAERRHGLAKGLRNVLLATVGLRISGSILYDGRLVRGSKSAAGHLGHVRVPNATEMCSCGRRGCLDTVASGDAVLRHLGVVPKSVVSKKPEVANAVRLAQFIAQAIAGDAEVAGAFYACGMELGRALNAVLTITDPEVLMLGANVVQAPSYVAGVEAGLAEDPSRRGDIPLVVSDLLGDEAAVWLALDRFVFSQQLDIGRLPAAAG
ncbi:MAG: ROK family transcriptional regulator [Alphaproteobacteria bacterium]|nr:ROK family transcriptional regulator [Alphaproteobacteria bacterium]